MKARIIEQIGGEPGLLLSPSSPEGEFIGAIELPTREFILEIAKQMLLVKNVQSDVLGQSASLDIAANIALEFYVAKTSRLHEKDYKIINGAEGVILDRYDEENGPVNSFPLALNAFREVVLY
jgi:hypothetical protein